MELQKLKINNFLSIESVELEFKQKTGLLVINGFNKDTKGSNGSGKSSILEAIYWGLTGKTLRKSTEETLVNIKNKKNCFVVLQFNDFVIKRSKRPTKLEFTFKGKVQTKASMNETQECIDSTLGLNQKLISASTFFGQHNDLTFLDATSDEKRTIIRNFLNLDEIFFLRDKIKNHKSEFYTSIREKEASVKELSKNLDRINLTLKELHDKHGTIVAPSGVTAESILAQENSNKIYRSKIYKLKESYNEASNKLQNWRKVKAIGPGSINHQCDKCGVYSTVDNSDIYKESIKYIPLYEKSLDAIYSDISDAESQIIPTETISRQLQEFNKISELLAKKDIYEQTQKELQEQVNRLEKEKNENLIKYEVMKFWEKAFSEQGLIKYIIRNILLYFNSRCNYYLSYLTENKYFIEFDEELVEKITTNSQVIHYISLSGGEKRKTNLAVLLALKDLLLLTNKNRLNLLCFDEALEGCDDQGVQGFTALINELKKDKLIFMITHDSNLKSHFDSSREISIIKENNTTKLAKKFI